MIVEDPLPNLKKINKTGVKLKIFLPNFSTYDFFMLLFHSSPFKKNVFQRM
jgi:hypothetical protein